MPEKPIKILFTIPNFITAGSGQALLHVVKRLNRDLFSPSIAVLKKGGALEEEIETLGIPLLEAPFTVPPRPLITLPNRIWMASRQFRPYEFSIWHSYHYADDYTEPLIARASGAKGWIYTKKNMSWGGGRAWKLRTFLASRIAAQNTAMIRLFFSHPRIRRKVVLLPRGVDTDKFSPNSTPHLALRQRLGIGDDIIIVGCVAHLLPVKGYTTLIQAIARIPTVHLLIAGKPIDQEHYSNLQHLCDDLHVKKRVHFLGNIADIPALHAELDLFVLPTLGRLRMEGCPVALLEAMASGLPCIATDIPGSQDIIQSGISGKLVTSENIEALAAAIRELNDSLEYREKLGETARKHVLEYYTIEQEVAKHEALYIDFMRSEGINLP